MNLALTNLLHVIMMKKSRVEVSRNRFSRSDRLIQSRDFFRIKESGSRHAARYIVANILERTDSTRSRLGVITSKKVGSAVDRNRARRIMRAAFRSCREDFAKPLDLVLIARYRIIGRHSQDVEQDLRKLLKKNHLLRVKTPDLDSASH